MTMNCGGNGGNSRHAECSARMLVSESGKAISWAILLCAVLAGAYQYGGEQYLTTHVTPFYHTVILMSAILVSLAALGCSIHLLLLGGSSNGQIRKVLVSQNTQLLQMVRESNAQIATLEGDLGRCALKLSARGLDCLSIARRVVRSLEQRSEEIEDLLRSGSSVDLIDAEELSRKKLIISENAMDSLIGADPVPPLAPEEWMPSLKKLFSEIDSELKKAA